MNFLLWSPEIETSVQRVREHAEKPENWYRPTLEGTTPPGQNPAFVAWAGSTRAVFTWTVAPFGVVRHLTVSVTGKGRYPPPVSVYTLAHYFGFTGAVLDNGLVHDAPRDWQSIVDKEENCIVVQQLIVGVLS